MVSSDKWPVMLLAIDVPFFLFCILMIYFLIVQIRKGNSEFNSGFYKLFILLAVNDSFYYIEDLFFTRFPASGTFLEFYLGNSTILQVWENFAYTLNGYMTSFNLIGHTVIAFNRFTTVFLSQKYHWLWSGRRLLFIIIMIFILSLVTVSFRIYGPFKYIMTDTGIITMYDSATIRQIFPIERTILTVGTSVISLVFEVATIIKYRVMWKKLNQQKRVQYNKDIQLFIHSIFVCAAQNMSTSYFIVYWICLWNNLPALLHLYIQLLVVIHDLMFLGAPVFLFCFSSVPQDALAPLASGKLPLCYDVDTFSVIMKRVFHNFSLVKNKTFCIISYYLTLRNWQDRIGSYPISEGRLLMQAVFSGIPCFVVMTFHHLIRLPIMELLGGDWCVLNGPLVYLWFNSEIRSDWLELIVLKKAVIKKIT